MESEWVHHEKFNSSDDLRKAFPFSCHRIPLLNAEALVSRNALQWRHANLFRCREYDICCKTIWKGYICIPCKDSTSQPQDAAEFLLPVLELNPKQQKIKRCKMEMFQMWSVLNLHLLLNQKFRWSEIYCFIIFCLARRHLTALGNVIITFNRAHVLPALTCCISSLRWNNLRIHSSKIAVFPGTQLPNK